MANDELWKLDATAQAALVRSREVSALELVDAAIARIEALNPRINAVITPLFDEARRQARDGDYGDGPFAGVPMLLKDACIQVEGTPYYVGTRLLRDAGYRSTHTTELAHRFRRAGLHLPREDERAGTLLRHHDRAGILRRHAQPVGCDTQRRRIERRIRRRSRERDGIDRARQRRDRFTALSRCLLRRRDAEAVARPSPDADAGRRRRSAARVDGVRAGAEHPRSGRHPRCRRRAD